MSISHVVVLASIQYSNSRHRSASLSRLIIPCLIHRSINHKPSIAYSNPTSRLSLVPNARFIYSRSRDPHPNHLLSSTPTLSTPLLPLPNLLPPIHSPLLLRHVCFPRPPVPILPLPTFRGLLRLPQSRPLFTGEFDPNLDPRAFGLSRSFFLRLDRLRSRNLCFGACSRMSGCCCRRNAVCGSGSPCGSGGGAGRRRRRKRRSFHPASHRSRAETPRILQPRARPLRPLSHRLRGYGRRFEPFPQRPTRGGCCVVSLRPPWCMCNGRFCFYVCREGWGR